MHGASRSNTSRRWPNALRLAQVAVALLCLSAPAGCKRAESKSAAAAENPAEQRYPLKGEILAVDVEQRTLKVFHEPIPDYMPAMTMEFGVSWGDAQNAKPGQRIRAELVTAGDGVFRLEKIWAIDPATEAAVDAAAKALNQDTVIRGRKAYREVGETLPDFALYDQTGQVVPTHRFRGKQVMLNFIFTRCPIAEMCPAATAKFQQVQRLAREAGVANLELVSITLDPEYDTPGVLKDYALTRGLETNNWTFLTGPESAIKNLLTQLGVIAQFEGSLLKHTLVTLLIDEQGRIVHREDGSKWDVNQFVGKMRKE